MFFTDSMDTDGKGIYASVADLVWPKDVGVDAKPGRQSHLI
jgi:hypothetical protein